MYNAFNHDMMAVFGSTDTDVKGKDKNRLVPQRLETTDGYRTFHVSCYIIICIYTDAFIEITCYIH